MKNTSLLKAWISAARIRTLPLSVSGILIGSSYAYFSEKFTFSVFFIAILTTISYQLLSNFSSECRKDLEISNVEINEKIKNETVDTISAASRKKNDQTKYPFDGKLLPKSQYVYSVVTNYLKENPQLTLEQFKNSVFDRHSYGKTGQYACWKTYKEVMDLHYNGKGAYRFYVSKIAKEIETNKDKGHTPQYRPKLLEVSFLPRL